MALVLKANCGACRWTDLEPKFSWILNALGDEVIGLFALTPDNKKCKRSCCRVWHTNSCGNRKKHYAVQWALENQSWYPHISYVLAYIYFVQYSKVNKCFSWVFYWYILPYCECWFCVAWIFVFILCTCAWLVYVSWKVWYKYFYF